ISLTERQIGSWIGQNFAQRSRTMEGQSERRLGLAGPFSAIPESNAEIAEMVLAEERLHDGQRSIGRPLRFSNKCAHTASLLFRGALVPGMTSLPQVWLIANQSNSSGSRCHHFKGSRLEEQPEWARRDCHPAKRG